MKKQLPLLVLMLLPLVANAYDIEVKNSDDVTIYYNYTNNGTELEVTCRGDSYEVNKDTYMGNVVIPDEVTYMNRTRQVTRIGNYAFRYCAGLTSITIPNSVTSIGGYAFERCLELTSIIIPNNVKSIGIGAFRQCSILTSITIPNSVTKISDGAFANCSALTNIIIPNNVTSINIGTFSGCTSLTSINIPNGVTSIGDRAFSDCSKLTSVTIPNTVTSIGGNAFESCVALTYITIPNSVSTIGGAIFQNCSKLTSVTIPNSVTSIGEYAFDGCTSLTSITIPNKVTSIGENTFSGCSALTSVTIPNSVTSIGNSAFYGCRALTSVIIPNSVKSIKSYAFYGCSSLTSVTIGNSVTSIESYAFYESDILIVNSLIEKPFKIKGKTSIGCIFSLNTFNNATLYIPSGTIDKYKATEGWKDFFFIEESTAGGDTPPTPPTQERCEKPTISYQNGKLAFNCATDDATCQYSITDSDIKSGSGGEVLLTATYTISVYATKAGYNNSDVATATLCWIDVEPKTEGINNGIAQVPAKAVLIQAAGGAINVQGCDDGERIGVYSINGSQVGTAVSQNGAATVNTTLQPGSVAIIKVGKKSVKVMMK